MRDAVKNALESSSSGEGTEAVKAVYIYSDDWLSSNDIGRMSAAEERGFFRFLLAQSAEHNGKLPYDDVELGRTTLMGTAGWRKFLLRYCHLFVSDKEFIWNAKQRKGWLKHEKRSHDAKAAANARWMQPHMPLKDADAHANADARLKDVKTQEESKSKEKSLPLSDVEGDSVLCPICLKSLESSPKNLRWLVRGQDVHAECGESERRRLLPEGKSIMLVDVPGYAPIPPPEGKSVAEKDGDAGDTRKRDGTVVAGGGSQADAGPPPGIAPLNPGHGGAVRGGVGRAVHGQDAKTGDSQGPTPPDSHELGQSSRGKSTRQADADNERRTSLKATETTVRNRQRIIPDAGGPSAEAAPTREIHSSTDGAGGVDSDTSGVPGNSGIEADRKRQHLSNRGTAVASRGSTGPAPTPTDDGFAAWYESYSRKVGKSSASKAWARLSQVKRALLMKNWPAWLDEFRRRDSDHIPYPASFIRGACWEEPPPKPSIKSQTTAERLANL